MFEQILQYFTFNCYEVIALSLLGLTFLIQLLYYLVYYKKPYREARKREKESRSLYLQKPKVSVIISSENEVDELTENLPAILAQDYPDFEVVVVNNGSTDESDVLLHSMQQKYPNLYHTYLPYSNDAMFGRRKLALTIAIKAAQGDVLLFTEPYAKPVSDKWISSMIAEMSDEKEIVLGYAFFRKTKAFFNRIVRFDNHLFSMQYLSKALKNNPFIGTYRNIAFRKHLFFDNKGFASYLNLENGEDVFINQIINQRNTAVALSQDSFVEIASVSYSLWKQIKKSYSVAKTYFNSKAPLFFGCESVSKFFFYILLVGLLVYGGLTQHWAILGIAALMFILRLIVQLIVVNKSAKYFKSGKFYFSLILLDVLQPFYTMMFRTRHKKKYLGRK